MWDENDRKQVSNSLMTGGIGLCGTVLVCLIQHAFSTISGKGNIVEVINNVVENETELVKK